MAIFKHSTNTQAAATALNAWTTLYSVNIAGGGIDDALRLTADFGYAAGATTADVDVRLNGQSLATFALADHGIIDLVLWKASTTAGNVTGRAFYPGVGAGLTVALPNKYVSGLGFSGQQALEIRVRPQGAACYLLRAGVER